MEMLVHPEKLTVGIFSLLIAGSVGLLVLGTVELDKADQYQQSLSYSSWILAGRQQA